jgi:hypothetical protein
MYSLLQLVLKHNQNHTTEKDVIINISNYSEKL